jgi:hypothetical protein
MARTQVGGIRTVASRDAVDAGGDPDLSPPATLLGNYKHVFQASRSALTLSLKRRTVHWMPDGHKEEEIPLSKDGNRLDMIRFTDHFYKTNDSEVADAIRALPSEVYGVGALCWDYQEQVRVSREAQAAEIRARIAADPALAAAVGALTPSDKKDWDVPSKPAVSRSQSAKKDSEYSEQELEALTAPKPR